MRVLSLDLSTKVGWAVLDGTTLLGCGRITHSPSERREEYPINFIFAAKEIAARIQKIASTFEVKEVVIEETNQGSVSRFSQKILEFIHFAVCEKILDLKIKPNYVNSRAWQSEVGAKLTKEQRKSNMILAKGRRQAKEELKNQLKAQIHEQMLTKLMDCTSKEEAKRVKQEAKDELKLRLNAAMRSFKVEGIKSKVTTKHLSVNRVNEIFGLKLKMKDNDIADATLLGVAYIKFKERGVNGTANSK